MVGHRGRCVHDPGSDLWLAWPFENVIVDANNVRHDWRRELARVLTAEQQPDGCWLNPLESENFREAHPAITTGLAIMTLSRIASTEEQKPRKQHVATGHLARLDGAVPCGAFRR